jgi:2-polyprenyl-6-methoxyphenol hydroxylase-like FAD-dependent oxidoreductase
MAVDNVISYIGIPPIPSREASHSPSDSTMSETNMSPPSIRIIGAGLSGLALGQRLRRSNIPTVIYERVKANPTRNNYGITLYKSTYKPLLETLQITEDDFRRQVGVQHPDNGTVVSDDQRLRVNRAALTSLLESNLEIRYEHKLANIQFKGTSRCAAFLTDAKDHVDEYDLLIGADGVHSAVRSMLNLPRRMFDLEVLPYVVFNGKRRIAYTNLPSGLLDCFTAPDGIQHTTRNGVVLSIKADFWNPDSQTVAVSYTLSRPAASMADRTLLRRNISDAETLAKQFMDEVAALGQLPAPFNGVFNLETMSEDRLLHWLMRSSLIDKTAVKDTTLNTVLLGDAAHAQPIPGHGANLAIDDALELAKHISAAGTVDIDAYLRARRQVWINGKRDNERALAELHSVSESQARI